MRSYEFLSNTGGNGGRLDQELILSRLSRSNLSESRLDLFVKDACDEISPRITALFSSVTVSSLRFFVKGPFDNWRYAVRALL